MTTLIDIAAEQERVKEQIKAQGLRVLVCAGTGCVANGSLNVIEKFKELGVNVRPMTQQDKVTIVPTGCHGFCEQGVLVVIPDLHVTYVRVKVDTEDYRQRRKETLENLAKNIAYKVKRTKRSFSLEPMNPYERRIIHSALQNDKYVTTHSEGEEPFRRVVVTLKR